MLLGPDAPRRYLQLWEPRRRSEGNSKKISLDRPKGPALNGATNGSDILICEPGSPEMVRSGPMSER